VSEVVTLKAHRTNKILSSGYRVDNDPGVAVLRRADGSVVPYFPMWSFRPTLECEEAQADLAVGALRWRG
jgi:hypothetical protein